jgi:hypothetical protein
MLPETRTSVLGLEVGKMIHEAVQRVHGRISLFSSLKKSQRDVAMPAKTAKAVPPEAREESVEEQLACFQYVGNIFRH